MSSLEITKKNLEGNERIYIEQEDDWAECLTCGVYTNNNVYEILAHPVLTEQIETLRIQERSPFFWRLGCIFPRWRSFLVTVTAANNDEMLFIYDKPFGFPFLTFNRPEFQVFDHDETPIGSIQNVWAFAKIRMIIKDIDGEPIYEIVGSMWTPAYFWEPLCSSHFNMTFKILDLRKEGYELCKFKKTSLGCLKDWFLSSDKYELEIPSVINFHERVLIWVTIHEIDMMYFERKVPWIC